MNSKWSNRFIACAIIQGALITFILITTVIAQFIFIDNINIIQFLSLSFEGEGKWFFLGIIFYLIIVIAIAVTALFYNNLEIHLQRKFSNFLNLLAWIHLLGMNIGGSFTTILMIFVGLSGSGIMSLLIDGNIATQNMFVMNAFINPISISIGILTLGIISGGLCYILAYTQLKIK